MTDAHIGYLSAADLLARYRDRSLLRHIERCAVTGMLNSFPVFYNIKKG